MKTGSVSRKHEKGAVQASMIVLVIAVLATLGILGWSFLDPLGWQTSAFMIFMRDTNMMYLAPELVVTFVLLASVLHIAFSKSLADRQETWLLATVGVSLALILTVSQFFQPFQPLSGWASRSVFYSMFSADLFSLLIRTLLTFGTLLVLLFSRNFIDKKAEVPGEVYVLLLAALLGGMMLSGATDLIMVFVALETLGISSYILVAYLRGNFLSAEAGLKYLLYGGMATAILLFGFSILYGLSGHTSYMQIASVLPAVLPQVNPLILAIMTVMIVGGMAFKLTAAPFHMWAPDVYEGGPTPIIAFLSVISKIAAFALALRFFTLMFGALPAWEALISVLAVTSMVIGNVVALVQRNIKRLLAYSTIAHVGYLLLGLVVMTPDSLSSILYYLIAYLFMNLGAFSIVVHFENMTGREDIAAYAGLVRKRPAYALIFSIMLLSLAGIPITAGFFGKFFLFQAVAAAGSQYLWLVVVALLTSTISLYYYLNIIRLMVIAEPSEAVSALPENDRQIVGWTLTPVVITMLVCLYLTLGLGLWAQPVMTLSREAVTQIRAAGMFVAAEHAPNVLAPVLSQAQPKKEQ